MKMQAIRILLQAWAWCAKQSKRTSFREVSIAAVAVLALIEGFFVDHYEYLFYGSDTFALFMAFGFVCCIGIVVVSKWVGHSLLMRHDDPYTGEHVEAEPKEGDDA